MTSDKEVNERIDEGLLRWFGYVEKMKNDIIAKMFYVWSDEGSKRKD